ncbi:MAG: FAD-dependent oxidoreductase [Acidimicrobiales bacterium]|jgi:thioredoxin reductase (NADPH)
MADDPVAFPLLDEIEIGRLEAVGSRRSVGPGEYLFREGDPACDFYVVLSGAVDIFMRTDGADRLVTHHVPGRFVGELNLLTGQRTVVSAVVAEPGEVLVVGAEAFRQIIRTDPRVSDRILSAFLARRSVLFSASSAAIRVVGSRFSPELTPIREFLYRSRIPHELMDPDQDAHVDEVLREFGVTPEELPVVIATGSVLRRPTPGSLAEYLGLTVESLPGRCFDLVVVGAGPAGLAAAVYGASEGLATLALDMISVGGQAATSSRIENYFGFPIGISGGDLTQRAMVQAEKFGAHLVNPCAAVSLREKAGHLLVNLTDGTAVAGRAVIVATGARYRRLDATHLDQFEANGVYYAATDMEARLCAGSPVVVAGGGNSAGQASLFLAEKGCDVTIVIRGPDLGASMSRYLVDRVEAHERVQVRSSTSITALDGDQSLSTVLVTGKDGDDAIACVGLFSFIGADPASSWLSGCAALDTKGFVLTDRSLGPEHLDERWEIFARSPLPFETSHPGLFAVGDVRSGSTKRVAAAVGEGSAAVRSVHEYLSFSG